MSRAMVEATEKLVDDMTAAIRREREREATRNPEEEQLRRRYLMALRSINKLTEKEAGQLLRPAAQPQI